MPENTKWVSILKPMNIEFNKTPSDPETILYRQDDALKGVLIRETAFTQRLINMFPVKNSMGEIKFKVRDLATSCSTHPVKATRVNIPRGIFYFSNPDIIIEAWDSTLYTLKSSTYVTSTIDAATNGPTGVTFGIDSSNAEYAFFSSMEDSFIISTANAHTAVSDIDFPATTTATPVYLDGYVFVAKENSRDIYNCNLGDPTSWTTSAFISTEAYGGNILALARQGQYVIAFCESHIEFFENAAIPAPNSPLQRVASKTKRIGLTSRATLAIRGDRIVFTGIEAGGKYGIFQIMDGEISKISSGGMDYVAGLSKVHNFGSNGIGNWVVDNFDGMRATGMFVEFGSELVYILNLGGGRPYEDNRYQHPAFGYVFSTQTWIEIQCQTNYGTPPYTNNWGGWCMSFCTGIQSPTGIYSRLSYMGQVPTGAKSDKTLEINSLSAINSGGSGELIRFDGGCGSATTFFGLQTPVSHWGLVGRKSVSGLVHIDSGSLGLYGAEPWVVGTHNPEMYLFPTVMQVGSTNYVVYNLSDYTVLSNLDNMSRAETPLYSANTFGVIYKAILREDMIPEEIALRVTFHEEY
jgi:hypothetical protein